MDAGGSSTYVCMFTSRAFARVNAAKCAEKEREREGGRRLQSPCRCPRNTVQNGRQGFRSVSYIYRSTWKAASTTADHRVSTVVATTNRSTIHVRYKHHPTHWTEEVSFTLYCSARALASEDVSFSFKQQILKRIDELVVYLHSYIGGKIRIWFRRISFMDYTFRVFCVSVTRTFYFYIFIFVSISHGEKEYLTNLSSINYSHSSMHNNDDIY